MKIPILRTSNLLLRPWTLEDTPALFQILQEPEILRYFPPTTFTLEKTRHYIIRQLKHWHERGYGHWAVVIPGSDQVVGWNGLEFVPELGEVEVAYLLSQCARGRGFGTQAARAAIAFGFETCRLPALIGLVHPENTPSVRVLEKCGLVFSKPVMLWGMEMYCYRIARTSIEQQPDPIPPASTQPGDSSVSL